MNEQDVITGYPHLLQSSLVFFADFSINFLSLSFKKPHRTAAPQSHLFKISTQKIETHLPHTHSPPSNRSETPPLPPHLHSLNSLPLSISRLTRRQPKRPDPVSLSVSCSPTQTLTDASATCPHSMTPLLLSARLSPTLPFMASCLSLVFLPPTIPMVHLPPSLFSISLSHRSSFPPEFALILNHDRSEKGKKLANASESNKISYACCN
jgi:hypothetical protein